MKIELTLDENNFAIKQINSYYANDGKSKYGKCIKSTLDNLENGMFDLNELLADDYNHNIIIKKLFSVFFEKLQLELEKNKTGVFGVTKAHYPDGIRWYYKNPIKKEFFRTSPVYANSLQDLKAKIKKRNDFWFILDGDIVKKQRDKFGKNRYSSNLIDLIIEINSKSDDYRQMRERENERERKAREIDELTNVDRRNDFKRESYGSY